tara:strand:- start:1225 stop:1425 length:201 start_codon:yes stop_codon:yes gene_type:complete
MKILIFILSIGLTSCVVPQHIDSKCCDKHTYTPHYQPTKIVIVKKNKPKYKKRRVKVKVNKHRKRK